jgi:hypothetical protein
MIPPELTSAGPDGGYRIPEEVLEAWATVELPSDLPPDADVTSLLGELAGPDA